MQVNQRTLESTSRENPKVETCESQNPSGKKASSDKIGENTVRSPQAEKQRHQTTKIKTRLMDRCRKQDNTERRVEKIQGKDWHPPQEGQK